MKNWHGAHEPAHALKREEQEAITHLTSPYTSFGMLRTAKPRAGLDYAGSLVQMVPICSSTGHRYGTHRWHKVVKTYRALQLSSSQE